MIIQQHFHFLFFLFVLLFSTSCSTQYPDAHYPSVPVYKSAAYSAPVSDTASSRYPYYNKNHDYIVLPPTALENPGRREAKQNTQKERVLPSREIPNIPANSKSSMIAQTPNRLNALAINKQLFEASERGDMASLLNLIEQGADVSSVNANGETALHSAAAHSQLEVAKLLIRKGADINASTVSGWTPLHSASRFGYPVMAVLLLDNGAIPTMKNKDGKTPLDLSRQAGHQDVVRILQSR